MKHKLMLAGMTVTTAAATASSLAVTLMSSPAGQKAQELAWYVKRVPIHNLFH